MDVAKATGAKYFSVPDDTWRGWTKDEQWATKQTFLDRGIANGDTILLATPIDAMRVDSDNAKEIDYLFSKGDDFNDDGTALVPAFR